MFRREFRGVVTHDIADHHAEDSFHGRVFCRHWTVPPGGHHVAPSLQGYTYRPPIRSGTPTLRFSGEMAMWHDPTDLKGESRKVLFT